MTNPISKSDKYNDKATLVFPPGIAKPHAIRDWSRALDSLIVDRDLTDVPLHSVKVCNATWGHYGEMAGGQPWVVAG